MGPAAQGPLQAQKILDQVAAGLEFMAYVPVLPVSVKTGYNLSKVFPLVNDIYGQSGRRVATRELNLLLREITARVPPPRYRDRPVKFFYLTQAEVQPPTFIAFVNQPQGVPDSYRRFLVKQLRERLNLPHAPGAPISERPPAPAEDEGKLREGQGPGAYLKPLPQPLRRFF